VIAAISLMRRKEAVTIARFRRHWLDVHGPLVCGFPGLRRYAQCHTIDSTGGNEDGLNLRIDGVPILYFDNDTDRQRAHASAAMAACNIDSRQFVGAVGRIIADVEGDLRAGPGRFSLLELWPEGAEPTPAPVTYRVREQGAAPNSTIPCLPIVVGAVTQHWFGSLVDLECAVADGEETAAARLVVEEHWLV
jgi:uncharacterized protein (TIGR02118 family)